MIYHKSLYLVFIVLINILTVISSFDSSKSVNQKMTAKETRNAKIYLRDVI